MAHDDGVNTAFRVRVCSALHIGCLRIFTVRIFTVALATCAGGCNTVISEKPKDYTCDPIRSDSLGIELRKCAFRESCDEEGHCVARAKPPPAVCEKDPTGWGVAMPLGCGEERRIVGVLEGWGDQHRHTLTMPEGCPLTVSIRADIRLQICATPSCSRGSIATVECANGKRFLDENGQCCFDTSAARSFSWSCDADAGGSAAFTVQHDELTSCAIEPTQYDLSVRRE